MITQQWVIKGSSPQSSFPVPYILLSPMTWFLSLSTQFLSPLMPGFKRLTSPRAKNSSRIKMPSGFATPWEGGTKRFLRNLGQIILQFNVMIQKSNNIQSWSLQTAILSICQWINRMWHLLATFLVCAGTEKQEVVFTTHLKSNLQAKKQQFMKFKGMIWWRVVGLKDFL